MTIASRWSFSQKLMLANLAYLLPCAVLVFFLVKEKNAQLEFSAKEKMGLEFQRPLTNLLLHIGQHKTLTRAYLKGEPGSKERLESMRNQIDSDFGNLDEVESRLGQDLGFTDQDLGARKRINSSPKILKTNWQTLVDKLKQANQEELFERHDQLLDDVMNAVTHVGDSSNLILDPDLDSYYIMDITLLALPKAFTHIQQTMNFLQNQTWDQTGTDKNVSLQLSTFAFQLKDTTSRISGDIQTSINEDKKFYGQLPSLQRELPIKQKEFVNSMEKLIHQLDRLVDQKPGESGQALQPVLISSATEALDQSYILWIKSAEELEKLLEIRMNRHEWERFWALVLAILAWLPPALLALFTVHKLSRSFTQAVDKLETEAEGANASSAQLASASSMVSSGSTEQAAAIQETGASMSEIASMIARSSSQAQMSQELAHKVTQRADEGCTVMERLVMSMESIHEANSQLQNISNIINEISTKTNVINEIVGKTQLLSFNASIEAARAGQHGRGFAVVAEEVGNLAQTSGNAAKSIRELIEDSQKQVAHILKTTLERVTEGKSVTEQAQQIFSEIAKDISMISTQVESVTEAAREQQLGIEQISKAMIQMDQTTQSNNKAAHLAATLSDQLAGQSHKLAVIARSVSQLVFGQKAMDESARKRVDEYLERTPVASLDTLHRRSDQVKILRKKTSEAGDDASLIDSLARKGQSLEHPAGGSNSPSVSGDDDSFKEAV
ncbi:MAG TPA: methyl-accepting chemotaxis protein [Oligoflexus sp.]|uniref:methyl-accepting chemotaxis protein n=1 Tax=Oligoflexus sp. TaxID=1971216 RepID=UPI002D698D6C|nr:methyl-accepting chemotaxis protein [Oligoflexus sp.]HYX31574.1 methyl-accepting chemotaxis protein [Oligoflexus sp.]